MMAPVWKRILKWIAWFFGGALTLLVVAYLTLLAINWQDKPPSEAAQRLAAAYRDRPAVADEDNAYIYAMGFAVAPDGDPREAGPRRIEWGRSLPEDLELAPGDDPVPSYQIHKSSRSPAAQNISDACRSGSQECDDALAAGNEAIRAWIEAERWLLDRYLTLLQHSGWLETAPYDPRAPYPAYDVLFDGQKQLLAQAYLLAGDGDAAGVREVLGNDARFWRRVLASSDTLITKMVATKALTRTFAMGNLAIRRLPAESQLQAMPPEWTESLSIAERSMFRCMTGEWISVGRLIKQIPPSQTPLGEFSMEDVESSANKAMARAAAFMMRPQDFSNRQADLYIRATETLDVPVEQMSASFEKARAIFNNPDAGRSTFAKLYNPIGSILLAIGASAYEDYAIRVADTEGARRVAVLTTELRARKINEQDISAELAASDIRAPYNGAPFTWEAEERAILFIGLEPGERGRHAFKY